MVKKRVLAFFSTLFLFAFLLSVIQVSYFEGITGKVISGTEDVYYNDNSKAESFSVILKGYSVENGRVRVYYDARDNSKKNQKIYSRFSLIYEDNLVRTGFKEVVLSEEKQSFVLDFPDNGLSGNYDLKLVFSNEAENMEGGIRNISVSSNRITGKAILENSIRNISFMLIILSIIIAVLFVSSKFYNKREIARRIGKSFDSKFIKLDFGVK